MVHSGIVMSQRLNLVAVKRGYVRTFDLDPIQQRREARKPLSLEVVVSSLPSLEVSIAGQLRDISTFGLGLAQRVPIRVGSFVAVEWADRLAVGEVIYCAKSDDGSNYLVGFRTDYLIIDRTTPIENRDQPDSRLQDLLRATLTSRRPRG
jgi:hypothetical protein